jgi:predicted transcriptional regulator
MSTMSVRLPESLHKHLKELATQEGVSMNQFITLAVTEKVAALTTVDYLKERAKRGSRQKFEAILANVPDVEPEEYDRL